MEKFRIVEEGAPSKWAQELVKETSNRFRCIPGAKCYRIVDGVREELSALPPLEIQKENEA